MWPIAVLCPRPAPTAPSTSASLAPARSPATCPVCVPDLHDAALAVLAHGSTKGNAPANPALRQRDALRTRGFLAEVTEAFWKQEPFITHVRYRPADITVYTGSPEGYSGSTITRRGVQRGHTRRSKIQNALSTVPSLGRAPSRRRTAARKSIQRPTITARSMFWIMDFAQVAGICRTPAQSLARTRNCLGRRAFVILSTHRVRSAKEECLSNCHFAMQTVSNI